VEDTVPHLVVAVEALPTPFFEQLLGDL